MAELLQLSKESSASKMASFVVLKLKFYCLILSLPVTNRIIKVT
jgi:hypothetical protein